MGFGAGLVLLLFLVASLVLSLIFFFISLFYSIRLDIRWVKFMALGLINLGLISLVIMFLDSRGGLLSFSAFIFFALGSLSYWIYKEERNKTTS